jgi:hypothetical protein
MANEEFSLEDWQNSAPEPFELTEEQVMHARELFKPLRAYLAQLDVPYVLMMQTALFDDGGCFLNSTSSCPTLGRTGNEVLAGSILMNQGLVPMSEIIDHVVVAAATRRRATEEGPALVPHPTIQ